MDTQADPPQQEPGDLWVARCDCGATWSLDENNLREQYPENHDVFDTGEFEAQCSQCLAIIPVTRVNVKVVPFAAWTMLPPADGCLECGREHLPELPHDLNSLSYQYGFRLKEAKAGRTERFPTWADAMAHCTQQVKESWIIALVANGADARQFGDTS